MLTVEDWGNVQGGLTKSRSVEVTTAAISSWMLKGRREKATHRKAFKIIDAFADSLLRSRLVNEESSPGSGPRKQEIKAPGCPSTDFRC